jgi:hypothetical protein
MDISGAEPNLAFLEDGTVFVTAPAFRNGKANLHEGAAYLWRSTDQGASWDVLRSPSAQGPLSFCTCDADVVTSPDGWVYYTDWWITPAGQNFVVEASGDGGATWQSTPLTTTDTRRMDRQWLIAGEDGFVGLFYSYFGTVPSLAEAQDTPYDRRAICAPPNVLGGNTRTSWPLADISARACLKKWTWPACWIVTITLIRGRPPARRRYRSPHSWRQGV